MEFLKESFPVWSKLTREQQRGLLEHASEISFSKGTVIPHSADNCMGLILVKTGQLRVYILSDGGKELTLYRLFPYDTCLFSAACLMNNIQFDVYIEAQKDTEGILIPASYYQKLCDESLAVSNFTTKVMASSFTEVMWLMEQIVFKSFDTRLASFLLEWSGIEGSATIRITQDEIARNLGTAREVVSRMLKYFSNEGILKIFRGGLEIVDYDRLYAIASK